MMISTTRFVPIAKMQAFDPNYAEREAGFLQALREKATHEQEKWARRQAQEAENLKAYQEAREAFLTRSEQWKGWEEAVYERRRGLREANDSRVIEGRGKT